MANLPVPAPRTWTTGEVGTGAYENSLRDALNFLLAPPRARLTQASAATSVNGSAWTSIGLDSTGIDTYGGHSNSTNNSRYTAQAAGRYRVTVNNAWAANTTGIRLVRVAVNGNPVPGAAASMNATSALSAAHGVSATVFLNVGDYVEMQGYQTTAGALSTSPGTSDVAPSMDIRFDATS